jgi:hypothetical protein
MMQNLFEIILTVDHPTCGPKSLKYSFKLLESLGFKSANLSSSFNGLPALL